LFTVTTWSFCHEMGCHAGQVTNPAWPRRAAVLVAALVGLVSMVGLAGCGIIRANRDTALALDRAGFHSASVNATDVNGNETVSVDAEMSGTASRSDDDRAANVVWTTFRYRVDVLNVDLVGSDGADIAVSYNRDDLTGLFGPRNAAYDKHTLTSAVTSAGRTALLLVGAGGVLFLIFIVVVIVLVVRSSQRRRAVAPQPAWGTPSYGYGYGYGYPAPPPAPPGTWGPPPGSSGSSGSWGQPPAPPGSWGPPGGPHGQPGDPDVGEDDRPPPLPS
jgi:hypothetical protein